VIALAQSDCSSSRYWCCGRCGQQLHSEKEGSQGRYLVKTEGISFVGAWDYLLLIGDS
jgi:hypothetical protein